MTGSKEQPPSRRWYQRLEGLVPVPREDVGAAREPAVRRARALLLIFFLGCVTSIGVVASIAFHVTLSPSDVAPVALIYGVGLAFCAVAALAAYFVLRASPTTGTLTALLVHTSPPMPGILGAASIGAYLIGGPSAWWHQFAVPVGMVVSVPVWLLLVYLGRTNAQIDRANAHEFGELQDRCAALERTVRTLTTHSDLSWSLIQESALERMIEHLTRCRAILFETAPERLRGSHWIDQTGYVWIKKTLHRVAQDLMLFERSEVVLMRVWHDQFRLATLRIPASQRDHVAEWLRTAEWALVSRSGSDRGRSIARLARQRIDEAHDGESDAIVRSRNDLLKTTTFLGLTMYLLMALALMADVPAAYVIAAAVYFLTAAAVGLFKRLYDQGRAASVRPSHVEDYGLATAVLLEVALLSGVAGVGGVALVGILTAFGRTDVGTTASASYLADIFSLQTHPFELGIAASFGLTPTLLLRRARGLVAPGTSEALDDLVPGIVPSPSADEDGAEFRDPADLGQRAGVAPKPGSAARSTPARSRGRHGPHSTTDSTRRRVNRTVRAAAVASDGGSTQRP